MSTITRSAIAISPEGEEADALRGWWDATGCSAVLTHAGEGLASALKCAQPSDLDLCTAAHFLAVKELGVNA